MKKNCSTLLIGFCLCVLLPGMAMAVPTLTIIDDITFGQFAVRNNDAVHTIVVDENNNFSHSAAGFVPVTDPQRGEFLLEDLPPNSPVTVSVADTSITLNGGGVGTAFSIRDYTFTSITTDGAGNATFYMGATLRTSGTGQYYESGSYSGTAVMTVNY